MTVANAPVANVSRAEFEELTNRIADLERSRATAPATQGEEFVRQVEFRLFKWVAASVVALTVAGFGVLYEMTSELQVGMERGFGELRGRLVRIETQLDGVQGRLDQVESRLDAVEKRLEGVPD